METTIAFHVTLHRVDDLVALFIKQTAFRLKLAFPLCEIIIIHKIITRIIRRVDVNHLHLAEVGLAENFQDIKVVALDIKVLSLIKINTLFPARAERHGRRRIR